MEQKHLSELLEKNIVVPEIQREYVWGSRKEIFVQFIDTLKDAEAGNIKLGFLYSYSRNGEEYIIDGQQRFTTLVLLLYYLSLKNPKNTEDFRRRLKTDSANMAFTYRVRTNTEQFMKDLFASGVCSREEILDSPWYHQYYDNDLTIRSMINFLDCLKSTGLEYDYDNLLNVSFWYYPVDKTSMGEELYITMNSRGKALDSAEHLKPLLMKNEQDKDRNWGKVWDNWEEFFFRIRGDREISCINVAMNNFIRLVWELETCGEHDVLDPTAAKEDIELGKINLKEIWHYFTALEALYSSEFKIEINRLFGDEVNGVKDANMLILKSLLCACRFHTFDKYEHRRVYERVYNAFQRRRILNHIPLLKLLKKYRECYGGKTFYEIILENCGKNWNDKDYPTPPFDEKECKLVQLIQDSINRDDDEISISVIVPFLGILGKIKYSDIEEEFWRVCRRDIGSHKIWNGDLSILIGWSCDETGKFDLSKFRHYADLIDALFPGKDRTGHEIDTLRRALIVGLRDYLPVRRGVYQTFGWEWSDWRRLIDNNPDAFKEFIDEIGDGSPESMSSYIQTHCTTVNKYTDFAVDNYLLDFTHNSCSCDIRDDEKRNDYNIYVKGSRHTRCILRYNALILKEFGGDYKADKRNDRHLIGIGEWGVWYWADKLYNCVVMDNVQYKIDIRYDNKEKSCSLTVKCSNNEPCDLTLQGFEWIEKEYTQIIRQTEFDPKAIKQKVIETINEIDMQKK
ncbi:MAG: DUF262 domain-containing protein [Bacteroidetes bacterium]|uniref:DUF262 domain-containing protein n=1 Tax=Candidatus Cryptobacteroides excrementipullorum TaxID=2840761 RepID=A0A9D9ISV9_9BACT|nr:DUF262 domain-containing protein [Candidatus Cryptobacteroides excrementipullorum]